MRNPTKKQVQKVIDVLTKANKIAKFNAPVDMSETQVEEKHICGTPMCHGGWYAVGRMPKTKIIEKHVSYTHGASLMSKDLGFNNDSQLEEWAEQNPELWGNKCGWGIFSAAKAFTNAEFELTSLTQIIDHWKGVQERLPK